MIRLTKDTKEIVKAVEMELGVKGVYLGHGSKHPIFRFNGVEVAVSASTKHHKGAVYAILKEVKAAQSEIDTILEEGE